MPDDDGEAVDSATFFSASTALGISTRRDGPQIRMVDNLKRHLVCPYS